jgi:TRAP-type C4-dicarboxylate transport system substrate-binding protein
MPRKLRYTALFVVLAAFLVACSSTMRSSNQQASNQLNLDETLHIILAGYGPSTSSFSKGLTLIGNRLERKFGDQVQVDYVYNILDLGYPEAGAQMDLVEKDALTMGYVTMSTGIPALEVAALPFLFSDNETIRSAMDGPLGQAAIDSIEASSNLKIMGFYENGFRHISNSIRSVRVPENLTDLKIRVLAIQKETLELLGASPLVTPLPVVYAGLASGELEGQENPFENVITYRMYESQKFYTKTYHSYMSRPLFVNKRTFNSWPLALQAEFQAAVDEAIAAQRALHDQAETDSEEFIREYGGEVVDLTQEERQLFVEAVGPIYTRAKTEYSAELLKLVGL